MSENINRESQVLPFKSLVPSLNNYEGSLVETWAFKLLYNDPANIQHFKDTRSPLPLEPFLNDEDFIYAISASEPGKARHYYTFRNTVEKLRPTEAFNNRRLFASADTFIAELNTYLRDITQLVVFDVYLEILKKCYDPWSDIELYGKVGEPVNIHLMEAQAIDNEPSFRLAMQNQWKIYHDKAVQSTQRFLQLKESDEMVSMFDTMEYVNEKYEEREEAGRVSRANRMDARLNEHLRQLRERNWLIRQWEIDEEGA